MKKIFNNHIIMSGFYKGISGLSLFMSIPILIMYLGQKEYGVWVLVYSLFQVVLLMDFGVQSTLKTKIPILIAQEKKNELINYIKVNYLFSVLIAILIFVILTSIIYLLDLKSLLNINYFNLDFIRKLFVLNIFFFCISFVANIHKSLYVAFLRGKYAEASIAINQFGFLVLLFICVKAFPDISPESKLILVTILNGLFCFFINAVYTFIFFRSEKISFKSTKNLKDEHFSTTEILNLGVKFMVVQIAVIIFFTIDNYIISSAFTPKEIAPFDVVNKFFQFPLMILFSAFMPLWSIFSKKYAEKDKKTLLGYFEKFNKSIVYIGLFIILFSFASPYVISLWIGTTSLTIPKNLILLTAITVFFRIIANYYSLFLNGVGKLNNYILIMIISLGIKIPLSYFFIDYGFGINSVIISSLIIIIIWSIVIPIESYKIVKKINN